ncbi:hypothetical protein [Baekduia sp.]|jgi:hypothetical protein|uniref:hypothetical protein n=1 Tax=Baekduia sp. TaxID=2600305 RepID=UPI002E113E91
MHITREERDALWDLLVSDLMSIGDLALVLSRGDEDAAQRLHQRHTQDVRLLDHIGWQRTHHGQTFDLPVERDDELAHTIQRLATSAASALADALRGIDFDSLQRLAAVCRTGARATPRA